MPNNTRARSLFDKLTTLRAAWFDNLHISVGEHEIAQLELISAELEAAINEERQRVVEMMQKHKGAYIGADLVIDDIARELSPLIPLDDPEGENFEQIACEREKKLGK